MLVEPQEPARRGWRHEAIGVGRIVQVRFGQDTRATRSFIVKDGVEAVDDRSVARPAYPAGTQGDGKPIDAGHARDRDVGRRVEMLGSGAEACQQCRLGERTRVKSAGEFDPPQLSGHVGDVGAVEIPVAVEIERARRRGNAREPGHVKIIIVVVAAGPELATINRVKDE